MQQNDARALPEIDAMAARVDPAAFLAATGGSVNQQIVAPKLRWLQHHEPEVVARIATIFGSYDYITYRLTGVRSVDDNRANWNFPRASWISAGANSRRSSSPRPASSPACCRRSAPPMRSSAASAEAAAATGLAAGTPVVAGCADHVASAYVAGASQEGDLVLKFGGAGDILLSTGKQVTDPRLFIDYHIIPGLYFSNGCIASSGSLLNWMVREVAAGEQAAASAAGRSTMPGSTGWRAQSPPDLTAPCCCPTCSGRRRRCTIRMPAARWSGSA